MSESGRVFRKWIENFSRSPLVRKESKTFDRATASQLFYGKTDDGYSDKYPEGFERFYHSTHTLSKSEILESLLRYLHFVGVRLDAEIVAAYLKSNPGALGNLLKRTYYILKTLAHAIDLDVKQPFKDNYGNIEVLVRIQTRQAQLPIFETKLPEIYGQREIPAGYGNDPIVSKFFDAIESSSASYFISGKAGTGKSTFIHYFTRHTKKTVLLMAFTGIAAINVGGTTIHSFFRFPLKPLLPGDDDIKILHENDQRRKVIEGTDTIIIDEVSMLRADVLQAIDHSLRQNGGDEGKPFGGKQIIFVGDLFQLPPVTNDGDEVERYLFKEMYRSPYFFDSEAYTELDPKLLEFTHSHRQREDLGFVALLDRVRRCDVDDAILEQINERLDPAYVPPNGNFSITLTTNNAIADMENGKRLVELPTTAYTFNANIQGDFEKKDAASAGVLVLKKDAQVMFTKNDSTGLRRWVNGTIGKVDFIAEDIIEVRLPDGNVYKLERETWEHRGYKYDKQASKVTSAVKGVFIQFPVKLAWAITIHKSQGLTFDRVIIDMGPGAFVNGQLYTALSRCRTLDGIVLRRKILPTDVIQDRRLVDFYEKLLGKGRTGYPLPVPGHR